MAAKPANEPELGITDKDIAPPVNGNASRPPLNIYQKLVRIMAAIGHLEKRGEMKAENKKTGEKYVQYTYLKASDLFDAIRPEFVTHGLLLLPELMKRERWDKQTASGGVAQFASVTYRFHIIDSETGQRDYFDGSGSGMDYGDKAEQKAALVALKYALRNTFLVADDSDDADAPAKEEKKARKSSDKRKFEAIKGVVTELRIMGKDTVWLKVNNWDTWIRSVNSTTSAQLKQSQDCQIDVTAYWDRQKGKTGEEADVMTITRVAGVWESKPKTGWTTQKPEDESQDDEHVSPDMEGLFKK